MKKIILNIIKKYFFIITGFIFLITYIYLNFIRERLPKDIPFELTEFRFYILCIVCFGYSYIIYRILKPKIPSIIIVEFLNILFKPLYSFFQYLYTFKNVSSLYNNIWINIVEYLNTWSWADNILFIYLLQILPRLLLLSIFIVDVSYVHKIEVFYYFIILGFLPLIYIIFIKYLENILEEYLILLEYLYTDVNLCDEKINHPDYDYNPKAIYHDKTVTIRKYLEIQYELFLDNENDVEYEAMPFATEQTYDEYENKYNKTSEELNIDDYKILSREFDYLMPKLLTIKIFLNYMTKEGQKTAYIPEIKTFILCMYLSCWLYILFVSIHTLQNIDTTLKVIEILTQYSRITEPFSDTYLSYIFFLLYKENNTKQKEKNNEEII